MFQHIKMLKFKSTSHSSSYMFLMFIPCLLAIDYYYFSLCFGVLKLEWCYVYSLHSKLQT
jgi:hypothetical protein